MQPYFLPYIGYFQLINAVDLFIVYDNIKYTKKGWINRNRLLVNGKDAIFSLPLKKGSDSLDVVERELAADFNRSKLLNQFKGAYSRAPQFSRVYPLLEQIVLHDEHNLFRFIRHALDLICQYLGITTEIRTSSTIESNHQLSGQDRVIAICHALGADTYINPIGGTELYSSDVFKANGIILGFLKPTPFEYSQLGSEFVPWLSIIDVMMFNPLNEVCRRINDEFAIVGTPQSLP